MYTERERERERRTYLINIYPFMHYALINLPWLLYAELPLDFEHYPLCFSFPPGQEDQLLLQNDVN
jgi:hypothetical protein